MKLHKLISRTVLATALLGVVFGGALSSDIPANALQQDASSNSGSSGSSSNSSSSGQPQNGGTINTTPSSDIKYSDKGSSANNYTNGSTMIKNGSLSLDSVPTLNFQDNSNSNNNKLQLQNSGQLKVTDYRNKDQGKSNVWSLHVTSNGFSQKNSNDNNDWQLNLNKTSLDSLTGNNGQNITASTQINSLNLSTNNSFHNNGDLVTNGQYGITQLSYGTNNDDATLNVPNVQPDLNNPYTTQMTWNLNTNVSGNSDN